MANPKLPDDLKREAVEAVAEHGNITAAAKALGLHRNTFQNRYDQGVRDGFHLSPGARNSVELAGLQGFEADGGHRRVYDPETGKQIDTIRWSAKKLSPEDIIDRMRSAFDDIPAAPIAPPPMHSDKDLLTLYPLADVHLGMMAWGKETGEDYDTEIAAERVRSWVAQCVASSPASETAIILGVGDLTHADDQTNMTPRSKHVLDVDTRHFKTLEVSISALATAIETAAAKHKRVIVRILPGNHDTHTYMAVMFALSERYRDDKRIAVQKVPGEFFAHEFGKVMIASHHGDKAKADRLVMFLADTYPELWGRTKHRFLFTGHLHHHKSQDIGGVQWEQLRAVTSKDAYATAHGYSARAQLQAVTFHRERGEVSRVKVSA